MAVLPISDLKALFGLGEVITPSKYIDLIDTLKSSGGGISSYTAPYADRPDSSEGDIFMPEDGVGIERMGATTWGAWGPIFRLNTPLLSSFSWINQGNSTASEESGGLYISGEPKNGTASVRLLKRTAPQTPYSILAGMIPAHNPAANSVNGICFRESSSGKLESLLFRVTSGGYGLRVWRYDGPEAWSSELYTASAGMYMSPIVWMKISDDGTYRSYAVSLDGLHWADVYSVSRTAYLVANEVGMFVDSNYDGNNIPRAFYVSWKEN